jgi:hypothetical protein
VIRLKSRLLLRLVLFKDLAIGTILARQDSFLQKLIFGVGPKIRHFSRFGSRHRENTIDEMVHFFDSFSVVFGHVSSTILVKKRPVF